MHRILLSTHGLRLRAPLRSRGLRSLGLGVFLASTAALAGCSSARSYACAVDRPMDCGAPGVGERRSFGSYLCEVDSPLACGATGVGAPGSYTCRWTAPRLRHRASGGATVVRLVRARSSARSRAARRTGRPAAPRAPASRIARPQRVLASLVQVLIPARYETVTGEIETVCPSVQRDWVPPIMETGDPRRDPARVHRRDRTPGATRLDRSAPSSARRARRRAWW
jgi:hypothetical protein